MVVVTTHKMNHPIHQQMKITHTIQTQLTIDGKILVVYYSATGNIEDARNIELVSATVENWDEYDRVFIGYPLWWPILLSQ